MIDINELLKSLLEYKNPEKCRLEVQGETVLTVSELIELIRYYRKQLGLVD